MGKQVSLKEKTFIFLKESKVGYLKWWKVGVEIIKKVRVVPMKNI